MTLASRASTTSTKIYVKLRRPPQGVYQCRKAAPSRLLAVDHRTPVKVTLTYQGWAEPWVRIVHQGVEYLRPGTMPVFELLLWLNGWEEQAPTEHHRQVGS